MIGSMDTTMAVACTVKVVAVFAWDICPAASVSEKHFSEELLCPVLSGGDPTGAVLLLAPDSARLEASDIKLASAAALLLSRQLS